MKKEFKLQTGLKRKTFYEILNYLTIEFNKAREKWSFHGIGVGYRFVLTITWTSEDKPYKRIWPTFYLKSNALYKSGEGTKETPYRISINE